MNNNYVGAASNDTLSNILGQYRDGLLELSPSFQRRLVWNDRHKENFIDTILNKYPFPEIYLCNGEVNVDSQKTKRLVVDGQQRINAIHEYVQGKMKCKIIKNFEGLSVEEKKSFLKYRIVIRDLGDLEMIEVKEIFKRINSIMYALNATEINNALYDGEYIKLAKYFADLDLVQNFPIFSGTQLSRMKDVEFFLSTMSTIEINGYFNRNDELEKLIIKFDNEYPNKTKMKKEVLSVFKKIDKIKLPLDSMWFRMSNFFSLFVELLKIQKEKGELPTDSKLKNNLITFEKRIEKNKGKEIDENDYAKYYYYVFQATASKTARIYRGKMIEKTLKS